MRWIISYGVASLGGTAVVLLALWGTNGFHGLGLGTGGIVAVVLSVLVATGLGVALMALVFYSDSSHADEKVYHATDQSEDAAETSASTTRSEDEGDRS